MKYFFLLALLLAGCSTTPEVMEEPLGFKFAGDGWLVALEKDKVLALAKRIEDTVDYVAVPFNTVDYQVFILDTWLFSIENRSNKDICVKPILLSTGYTVNIQAGWYHMPAGAHKNIGTLVQRTWTLQRESFLVDDSQWKVDSLNIVDFKEGAGCVIQ